MQSGLSEVKEGFTQIYWINWKRNTLMFNFTTNSFSSKELCLKNNSKKMLLSLIQYTKNQTINYQKSIKSNRNQKNHTKSKSIKSHKLKEKT